MLDIQRIRAISLDLDDTLWPIWPTIRRAESVLRHWLAEHAPRTAILVAGEGVLARIRDQVVARAGRDHPHLVHDLSALRRESIRLALREAGDDPALAEPAFEVFFAERQRVELFEDARPALEFLSRRYPLVGLSNGNADIHRIGIGQFFAASVSARELGMSKPDARVFQAAARRAGVAVDEVLHIGDDAALDALGALRAGMQAIWVNRDGQAWEHEECVPATVSDLHQLRALFAR